MMHSMATGGLIMVKTCKRYDVPFLISANNSSMRPSAQLNITQVAKPMIASGDCRKPVADQCEQWHRTHTYVHTYTHITHCLQVWNKEELSCCCHYHCVHPCLWVYTSFVTHKDSIGVCMYVVCTYTALSKVKEWKEKGPYETWPALCTGSDAWSKICIQTSAICSPWGQRPMDAWAAWHSLFLPTHTHSKEEEETKGITCHLALHLLVP